MREKNFKRGTRRQKEENRKWTYSTGETWYAGRGGLARVGGDRGRAGKAKK